MFQLYSYVNYAYFVKSIFGLLAPFILTIYLSMCGMVCQVAVSVLIPATAAPVFLSSTCHLNNFETAFLYWPFFYLFLYAFHVAEL